VLILCTGVLNRNWSLFLVTNKSIESMYGVTHMLSRVTWSLRMMQTLVSKCI